MAGMNLRTWYGSLRIPKSFSPDYSGGASYPNFLTSSLGLIMSVAKDSLAIPIRVAFDRIETAHADTTTNRIVISDRFYYGDFSVVRPEYKNVDVEQTITAILGIVVHEAAHFAWSPPDMTHWFKGMPKPFSEFLLAQIGNIVEDIYIEDRVFEEVPNIGWMLDGTNRIVFPPEVREDNIRSMLQTEDLQPALLIGHLLNFMLMAKVEPRPDDIFGEPECHPLAAPLWDMADSVRGMDDKAERILLCQEIYRRIMDSDPEMYDCVQSLMAGGEGGKTGKEGIEGVLVEQAFAEMGEPKPASGTPDSTVKAVGKALDRIARGDMEMAVVESQSSLPDIVVVKRILNRTAGDLTPDPVFLDLAKLARQKSVRNRPYGLDEKRGTNMRRLWRIATDEKIFAQRQEFQHVDPAEVIIFVDASGSMCGGVNGSWSKSKIQASLEAAYGAAIGLANGQAKVAVWAHSGDIEGAHVVLYKLKGWNEPLEMMPSRALTLSGRSESGLLCQNRDGDAIEAVAREFKDPRRKQVLIVISDGAPCANGYGGLAAEDHCRRIVNGLRRKKISVLSISIDSSAVSTNNKIYGEKFNTVSSDPNVISVIASQLIG